MGSTHLNDLLDEIHEEEKKKGDGFRFVKQVGDQKVYEKDDRLRARALNYCSQSCYLVQFQGLSEGINGDARFSVYLVGEDLEKEVIIDETFDQERLNAWIEQGCTTTKATPKALGARFYRWFKTAENIEQEIGRYNVNSDEYIARHIKIVGELENE